MKNIVNKLLLEEVRIRISHQQYKNMSNIFIDIGLPNWESNESWMEKREICIEPNKVSNRVHLSFRTEDSLDFDEELLLKCLGLVEKGVNKGVPIQIVWQALEESRKQGRLKEGKTVYNVSLSSDFIWEKTVLGVPGWIEATQKNYSEFFEVYTNVQEFKVVENDLETKINNILETLAKSSLEIKEGDTIEEESHDSFEDFFEKIILGNNPVKVNYIVKESSPMCHGESAKPKSMRTFESGSVRDSDTNKPLVKDLDPYLRLRYGYHMLHNSKRYSKGNWEKGQPTPSALESLHRHLAEFEQDLKLGKKASEDHLSAMIFGIKLIMLNEERDGVEANSFYNVH